MLARRHSLRSARIFNQVFRKNQSFSLGEILVLLGTEQSGTGTQIGITFQIKAFPHAHTRHTYKRRFLAALRPYLGVLPQGRIVILFRKPFPETHFTTFQTKVQALVSALSRRS